MRQDERAPFDRALRGARHADEPAGRTEAGGPGQDGEQEQLGDQPGCGTRLTHSHDASKVKST